MVKVLEESYEYDKYFVIKKGVVNHVFKDGRNENYGRFKLVRPDAVCILLLNEDTNKMILTKQFRYPISNRENEYILEAVAGKIDNHESSADAVVRETLEEVGYRIDQHKLIGPKYFYASPGYSSEKIFCYFAFVNDSMKDENFGGGLQSEYEEIEIVEIDFDEFKNMVLNNKILDGKTIIASMLCLGNL